MSDIHPAQATLAEFDSERQPMHEHPEYVVGWGTLSLINAGLAQSKGRSGLLWWLGSLCLGPIATLLIVILPRVPGDYS